MPKSIAVKESPALMVRVSKSDGSVVSGASFSASMVTVKTTARRIASPSLATTVIKNESRDPPGWPNCHPTKPTESLSSCP